MQERHNSITNALELRLSCTNPSIYWWAGVCFKKHLYLRAVKFSPMNEIQIFQCMGKIFCVVPLKFRTRYLTHLLKDNFSIQKWQGGWILPCGIQGPAYNCHTQSMLWLLMSWRCKETGISSHVVDIIIQGCYTLAPERLTYCPLGDLNERLHKQLSN